MILGSETLAAIAAPVCVHSVLGQDRCYTVRGWASLGWAGRCGERGRRREVGRAGEQVRVYKGHGGDTGVAGGIE